MKTLYVNQITLGAPVTGETFAVFEVKHGTDKNGKPYCDLVLADKTGQIAGKIWSDTLINVDRSLLTVGKVVAIDAKVESYKGRTQLNILSLGPVDEAKLDEYLASSIFPIEEMLAELNQIIDNIKDTSIKQLLQNLVNHPEWGPKLSTWSAGPIVHHDFRGGLLQHILEMLAAVNGLEKFYPEANFDIVRGGIIVHDIGKLMEIDCSGFVSTHNKYGVLIDHMALGLDILRELKPAEMPENIYTHLRHIILSHHGTKEFGSPVIPASIEAWLVCTADNMSAKPRTAQNGLKNEALDEDGMTIYNRWLGGRLWNGD